MVTLVQPTGKVSTRGRNVGKAVVKKTKVARGCGQPIVLWEAAVDKDSGKVSEAFNCPHCDQEWQKLSLTLADSIPVQVSYSWTDAKGKRRRSSRPLNDKDIQIVQNIEQEDIPFWVPDDEIWAGRELMTMGPNRKGIKRVSEFFTKRNLRGLGCLWHHISRQEAPIKSAMEFVFTSQINRASKLRRMRPLGPGEQLSGTLYVASLTVESNVFSLFDKALKRYCESVRPMGEAARNVSIFQEDARALPLPDNSADYIFTDPPFGGNIYYADAALLWEAWLGCCTDETKELVFNRQRLKDSHFRTIDDYERGMTLACSEMFRILKPGRWATIEFNNSDGGVFQLVRRAIQSGGFDIASMLLFDKKLKTFKQAKGEKGEEEVVDKDVLFNLQKPAVLRSEVLPNDHDVERQVADAVREHLQTLPDRIKAEPSKYSKEHRTTATINSMLMNVLIPRGVSVEGLNLPFIERVCARYFRKVGQRWYLSGEAVSGTDDSRLFVDDAAITDEVTAIDWLRQQLHVKSLLIGELKPLWMQATGLLPVDLSQSLVLEDLLSENFWRDADSNRWREPTREERERMNDDRLLHVLHDAERFVGNVLRRTTTDEERCDWIDVLFRACRAVEDNAMDSLPALRGFDKTEAYQLMPRLFHSVLRDHVSPDAYARAEKQARAASQRVSRQAEESPASESEWPTDSNQTALDFENKN